MDSNGNAMRNGGNYFDGIALDSDGNPFIEEYKASQTATYTSNQKANGFDTGALNKDLVVTGECGGVFKPGDVIPEGTPINTIRGK